MSHAAQKTAHRLYEDIAHSNITADIVGAAEVVGGIVAAPFTGGTSLALSAAGAGTIVTSIAGGAATVQAEEEAKQNTNQLSQGGKPPGPSGTSYTVPPQSAASTNAPGGSGKVTVPFGTDIIQEKADAANLQQVAYEQQALSQILTLKESELTAEGTISAGQATRGVKAGGGTAASQLAIQRGVGGSAIGEAVTQEALGDKVQSEQNLASFNAGLYNLSNEALGINQQLDTTVSNLWLSSLTSMVQGATSAINQFVPKQAAATQQAAATGNWQSTPWQETATEPYL